MKNWVLYLIILAAGIAVGLGSRSFMSSEPSAESAETTSEYSANDGHGNDTSGASTLDWCAEHRVPESQCTLCHPELIAEFKAKNDWCGGHGLPESHCRLCNPDIHFPQEPLQTVALIEPIRTSVFYPANVVDCATNNSIIQFASVETATRAGLSVEPVLNEQSEAFIEAPAEIRFDDTKTTTLTITVPVLVARWFVEPGDRIFSGQKLAELESPDIARLQADYLEASARHAVSTQELARAKSLRERDLLSQSEYEKLEADFRAAEAIFAGVRGLLLTAGFAATDCDDLLASKQVSQRYTLRATSNGLLVERRAPVGELLEAGRPLAMIGDPSEVWIEAQVRERDLAEIHEGQAVEFSIDGNAVERVAGKVIWVAQYLDPKTRTGTVRAKLLSAPGGVKANLFGRAKIYTDDDNTLAVVSRDAVQWEGCCNVVFVQEAVDRYRPRKVSIARGDNDHYRVLSGVAPGEMVVVDGSYLLKTELKKGSIGAGCCGLEAR
ncbi:MAG: efflux RND transporter periplasmic adaptor subunit [candidate division Zixibacteria bacterium]|nr:efflux RND transporter periplasmic adaptor subunit [candidate division Zixibacteria bacterium]